MLSNSSIDEKSHTSGSGSAVAQSYQNLIVLNPIFLIREISDFISDNPLTFAVMGALDLFGPYQTDTGKKSFKFLTSLEFSSSACLLFFDENRKFSRYNQHRIPQHLEIQISSNLSRDHEE